MAGWLEREREREVEMGENEGRGRSSPLEQLAQTGAKIGCGGSGGGRNHQRRAKKMLSCIVPAASFRNLRCHVMLTNRARYVFLA